jgi:hypothetical protein
MVKGIPLSETTDYTFFTSDNGTFFRIEYIRP